MAVEETEDIDLSNELTEVEIQKIIELRDALQNDGHTIDSYIMLAQYVIACKGRIDDCVKRYKNFHKNAKE